MKERDEDKLGPPPGSRIRETSNIEHTPSTYGQLRQVFVNEQSESMTGNANTTMNMWLKQIGKNDEDPIGEEIADDKVFDELFRKHMEDLQETVRRKHMEDPQERKVSTISNRSSQLQLLKSVYDKHVDVVWILKSIEDLSFSQALVALLKIRGISRREMARRIDADSTLIDGWARGDFTPSNKSLRCIGPLEMELSVPPGTLSSKLGHLQFFMSCPTSISSTSSVPFNKHLSKQVTSVYRVEINPQAQQGWDNIEEHKKEGEVELEGELFEQPVWNEVTAAKSHKVFQLFLSYLALPKDGKPDKNGLRKDGMGLAEGQLSFPLMTDYNLVKPYVNFLRDRTMGKRYNAGHAKFLEDIIALMQPGRGYFRHHPECGLGLLVPIGDGKEWGEWLDRNLQKMKSFKKIVEKRARKSGPSRDPAGPMNALLDKRKEILTELEKSVEKALQHIPPATQPCTLALYMQTILLIRLLILDPLRQKHFRIMRFGENLVKLADGHWWMIWKSEDFKNPETNKKGRRTKIPPNIGVLIDDFKENHRKHLAASQGSLYVFRVSKLGGYKKALSNEPIAIHNVYGWVKKYTKKFLYGVTCDGIGPNAFRDLVVTDYLSKNPNDWAGAAALIGDTEGMIRKHYSHLEQKDHYERAQKLRFEKPHDTDLLLENLLEENRVLRKQLDSASKKLALL